MSIYKTIPFVEVESKPTKLALKLQERIRGMFGIEVEPIIIRWPGSFSKTGEFRYVWSMRTECGRYEIACVETAIDMAQKKEWRVLDSKLIGYHSHGRRIGKVIY